MFLLVSKKLNVAILVWKIMKIIMQIQGKMSTTKKLPKV
jgi:hypothetical protein